MGLPLEILIIAVSSDDPCGVAAVESGPSQWLVSFARKRQCCTETGKAEAQNPDETLSDLRCPETDAADAEFADPHSGLDTVTHRVRLDVDRLGIGRSRLCRRHWWWAGMRSDPPESKSPMDAQIEARVMCSY